MGTKPTIKDVAKKAGVSIATVSFVLNKHPSEVISERVKKRVWAAARALDYHPSAAAAGLARKRTKNVAIIFYKDEESISNQFYSFVIQGAIKEAIENNTICYFRTSIGLTVGTPICPRSSRKRTPRALCSCAW